MTVSSMRLLCKVRYKKAVAMDVGITELKTKIKYRRVAQGANKSLSFLTLFVLISSPSVLPTSVGQTLPATTETSNPTDAAPQSAKELQALVAPIALYPDSLVAQILTAATFPDQVAIANYWLEQNKN